MARAQSAFEQRAARQRERTLAAIAARRFAPTDRDRAAAARDDEAPPPVMLAAPQPTYTPAELREMLGGMPMHSGIMPPVTEHDRFIRDEMGQQRAAGVAAPRQGDDAAWRLQLRREANEARDASSSRIRNGMFDFLHEDLGLPAEWAGRGPAVADFTALGDAAALEDAVNAVREGNYGEGAMLGGLGLLGVLPGGDLLAKPLTRAAGATRGVERAIEASRTIVPRAGQTPEAAMLLSQLPEAKRALITPANEDAFMRAAATQDPRELAAMTLAGAPKYGWYEESAAALQHVFGDDTPRFTMLLAATSPQTSVESNLQNATSIWKNWVQAGRPTDEASILEIMGQSVQGSKGADSVLPAWKNNTVTALSASPDDLVLSGPKVNDFGNATMGDLHRYVLDAWMANASGVPQEMFKKVGNVGAGYGPGYLGPNAIGNSVADQLTEELGRDLGLDIKPSHVQESVWSWAKAAYEARAAEGIGGRTARQLVEAGAITPEMIDAVPDFSGLLRNDTYGAALREAGYGSQLDTLADRIGAGKGRLTAEQREAFTGALDREALLRAADRLDELYNARTGASRTKPYRGGFETSEGPATSGYTRTGGSRGRTVRLENGEQVAAVHRPKPEFAKALQWKPNARDNPSLPDFNELVDDRRSRVRFSESIGAAKQSRGAGGTSVDVRDDYTGHRTFLTPDRSAGFAVSPDGELNSVFSAAGSPHKGITHSMMNVATDNGADWLSAFDIGLPEKYGRGGFRPTARLPWDDTQAPPDWDYERMKMFNGGRPDVVFMSYDPEFSDTVTGGYGGEMMDDYDRAVEMARSKAASFREGAVEAAEKRIVKAREAAVRQAAKDAATAERRAARETAKKAAQAERAAAREAERAKRLAAKAAEREAARAARAEARASARTARATTIPRGRGR